MTTTDQTTPVPLSFTSGWWSFIALATSNEARREQAANRLATAAVMHDLASQLWRAAGDDEAAMDHSVAATQLWDVVNARG